MCIFTLVLNVFKYPDYQLPDTLDKRVWASQAVFCSDPYYSMYLAPITCVLAPVTGSDMSSEPGTGPNLL